MDYTDNRQYYLCLKDRKVRTSLLLTIPEIWFGWNEMLCPLLLQSF